MSAIRPLTACAAALFLLCLAAAPPAAAASAADGIIVGWKRAAELPASLRLGRRTLAAKHLTRSGRLRTAMSLIPVRPDELAATLVALRRDPRIDFAEPNHRVQLSAVPADPEYASQWHLPAIGAENAWDTAGGGDCRNVLVGVVDTGIDLDHPDLVDNLWVNPGEVAGNGVDDDGNGIVDDVHGYNAVAGSGVPDDDHVSYLSADGHGTHVAGLIGAVADNALGTAGVCWQARLMALKFLDASGNGSVANAVAAIDYALAAQARTGEPLILNNSWTIGSYDEALRRALEDAQAAGALVIAAAGNSGSDNDIAAVYPANLRDGVDALVAVANTTATGSLYLGSKGPSNYGLRSVDLAAPGTAIVSTLKDGGYGEMTGTSMATPLVSGTAALLWARHPELRATELKAVLLRTARVRTDLVGRLIVPGELNAGAALSGALQRLPTLFRAEWKTVAPGVAVTLFGEYLDPVGSTLTLNGETLDATIAADGRSALIALPPSATSGYVRVDDEVPLWLDVEAEAPQSLSTQVRSSGMQLSWSEGANADHTYVERATPDVAYQEIAQLAPPAATYFDTGVTDASACYRVRHSYEYADPVTGVLRQRYSAYAQTALAEGGAAWVTRFLGSTERDQSYGVRLWTDQVGTDYSLAAGDTLPEGLSLQSSGLLSGVPAVAGSFLFRVMARPPTGCPELRTFSLTVGGDTVASVSDGEGKTYTLSNVSGAVRNVQWRSGKPWERQWEPDADLLEFTADASNGAAVVAIAGSHLGDVGSYSAAFLNSDSVWVLSPEAEGAQVGTGAFSLAVEDGGVFDRDFSVNGAVQLVVGIKSVQTQARIAGSEDRRCFIASAVYLDREAHSLSVLRRFRDEWLSGSAAGRSLIEAYYRHSPRVAWWLQQHPAAQRPVRAVLDAVVFSIEQPAAFAGILLLSLVGGFGITRHLGHREG